MELNKIYQHNVLDPWPLPDKSVNCIVTSPPYWNLRNYGVEGQLGLEKSPADYIEKMVYVFREAWRVLRDDGTLWVNIGDSYATTGGKKTDAQATAKSGLQEGKSTQILALRSRGLLGGNLKLKDLVGIPWMLAFALRDDGWYLRQDIIWSKPNPMPESAIDRCTKAHEYLFMFSKKKTYYYDAYSIRTPYQAKTLTTFGIESTGNGDGSGMIQSENWARDVPIRKPKQWKTGDKQRGHSRRHAGFNDRWDAMSKEEQAQGGANKRSVWTVSTVPFKEAHFATFPPELIVDPIKAGCPQDGIVLDPFIGSGTTAVVAKRLGRNWVGFELNPEYITMANKRISDCGNLFPDTSSIAPSQGYIPQELF